MKQGHFEHLDKIFDCLRENDLSIKKLALKVLEDLSNPNNVKDITKELLNYLIESESDDEIIHEVTEKLCSIIEIYAPTRRWQVDKIIRVLTLAGRHVTDDSIGTLL